MNRRIQIAVLVIVIVTLATIGVMALRHQKAPKVRSAAQAAPLYWYDPMRPSQHFDKPGKSPFMDMQLQPKYADGGVKGGAPATIEIDPRIVQTLGLRLAMVEEGPFARTVDAVGVIAVDEHRIEAIQVRQAGWVERLDVRAAGDTVRRGQLLAGVYSPDLLATQQELLIARNSKDVELIEAARRRLSLFGLSEAQIARIEKTGRVERRTDYFSPIDGYVMELGARQGAAVEPGATLFQLASLGSVWLIAEIPEAQAAWIKAGNRVGAQVSALPGERFEGTVDYLYPELSPTTRTLKVRIVLKNPHLHLRPAMFATAHLESPTQDSVLTVPTEALIRTGRRNIVILAEDAGHFRPAIVRVGDEHGDRSQIIEGLSAGQSIVASGQFLIDSEARLRSAFDALAGQEESPLDRKPIVMPSPGEVH